jgi:hypothetical protein
MSDAEVGDNNHGKVAKSSLRLVSTLLGPVEIKGVNIHALQTWALDADELSALHSSHITPERYSVIYCLRVWEGPTAGLAGAAK